MTMLSVELPEPLVERLEAIAQGQNLSKAEIVREALAAYVGKVESDRPASDDSPSAGKPPRPRSALESMGDLVGSLEGPGDLTTNPAYMEGFGES